MDRMTETMQLCCFQGTTYARNHSLEYCSSSVPSNVPPGFESVCILAMKQCCIDYFLMKNLCEIGIEVAMTLKTCSSLSIDTAKMCCSECSTGRSLTHNWNGNRTCEMNNNERNAQELLASDALVQCCKNASTILKMDAHTETVKKVNEYNVCEDYEPNELCEHHCIPIHGSYKCECNPGFILMANGRNCEEITKNSNPCQHKCFDNGVEVKCSCPRGYRLMAVAKTCKDNNECVLDKTICLPITQCVNISESYKCTFNKKIENQGEGPCSPGFARNSSTNACDDIDECAMGQAQCGPHQVCKNHDKGYSCSCLPGYRLISIHQCQDIDECATSANMSVCLEHSECINTVGSYECRCHNGLRSAPVNEKVCVDVDECAESRSGSLCQQRCNNVWGSYKCSCHKGYRLNPDNRTCSDVDECTEFKNNKLCVGKCLNEPGGYRCVCPSGYRLSEDERSCIDINECETGIATCARNQTKGTSDICFNTRGGYRCHRITCPHGYQLENKTRCTKIQTYCPPSDSECAHQPILYSFNFITFISNLHIPESKVNLFTMRGPPWAYSKMSFQLGIVKVDAPPSVKVKADINSFLLIQTANQAVIALVKPLEGPQSIEVDLSMELFSTGQFGGTAVAKLYIYVSEYEF